MNKSRNLAQLLEYLVFGFLLILVVAIFAVSYSAGIALLSGIILALVAKKLYRLISTKFPTLSWILAIIIGLIIPFLIILFSPIARSPKCALTGYRVMARASDASLNTLLIRDEIVFDSVVLQNTTFTPPSTWETVVSEEGDAFRLPERQILSGNRGFLLKQAEFGLPNNDVFSPTIFPDGLGHNVFPCLFGYTNVTLKDFPRATFFSAKDATDINIQSYIDIDTITWSSPQNITFAYIPPPFHYLRPILNLVVGISSFNQFFVIIIGVVSAFVITPVMKPMVIEAVQNMVKSTLFKKFQKEANKKASLIVSASGEEKEIEIKDK